MRWHLLVEEYGPDLIYIKGQNNVVADALSQLQLTEKEFSQAAFAFGNQEFPENYPLTFSEIQHEQQRNPTLQEWIQVKNTKYKYTEYTHLDKTYKLITKDNKIILPPALQHKPYTGTLSTFSTLEKLKWN